MKSVIIERSGRNPRRIKRLINSFVLEYHLNRSWDEIGVGNLVKVVMLQHFYPGFYRILTKPRGDDPITEFLRYHEFRSMVKQGGEPRNGSWRTLFEAKGIRAPGENTSATVLPDYLAELERELPGEFPALVGDRDFVALVESFDGGDIKSEQLRRMLRRPLTQDPLLARQRESAEAEYGPIQVRPPVRIPLTAGLGGVPTGTREPDPFFGFRILWIDDRPATNSKLTEVLRHRGALVSQAIDRTTALATLARERPDVVLSDFTRHGDIDAGINDLEYLRTRQVYDGPVIFCSGQGTPARRRRADELGALGPTNDENEIMRRLWQIAVARRPDEAARSSE